MDNQMLISMMGSSTIQKRDHSSKTSETNASAFSQCLEQATGTNAESKQSQELISEKSTPKAEAERQKTENADAQAQAKAMQAKMAQDPKALGSKAYLYDLMYRNPDTMSLADKQALKLDNSNGIGFKELQSMMSERGLNMRELSFTQMAALTKNSARTNVNDFLEALAKEKGAASTKEESTTQAKGQVGETAAAANKGETKATAEVNNMATAAVDKANEAKPGTQLSQTQKRQQVIDQIVTHMEIRNLSNRDELHLKLNPEYLGELKINLTKNENGELSARFVTTSDETREVLSESRSELRQHIEAKGIRLGHIDVDLVDELA